jgi:hypothetical protein
MEGIPSNNKEESAVAKENNPGVALGEIGLRLYAIDHELVRVINGELGGLTDAAKTILERVLKNVEDAIKIKEGK